MNELVVLKNMMLTDSVCIKKGPVVAGTKFRYFTDLANKHLIDTTFSRARRLVTGTKLQVDTVLVHLPATIGDVQVSELDRQKILEGGYLRLYMNNMRITEGPLWAFDGKVPQTRPRWWRRVWWWLFGKRAKSPYEFCHTKLAHPVTITSDHDLWAELTFYSRTWMMPCGINHTITLDGPVMVQLVLAGEATEVC